MQAFRWGCSRHGRFGGTMKVYEMVKQKERKVKFTRRASLAASQFSFFPVMSTMSCFFGLSSFTSPLASPLGRFSSLLWSPPAEGREEKSHYCYCLRCKVIIIFLVHSKLKLRQKLTYCASMAAIIIQ